MDLDAATGAGTNAAVVRRLLAEPGLEIQVGGGVRDAAAVAEWLAAGAARVIVGTRAIEDPAWLAGVAGDHPGRIVPAVDVRGRQVVTHGWTRDTGRDATEVLDALAGLPLGGVLVTAVHREGALGGTDAPLLAELAHRAPPPLMVAGGIASVDELRALARLGIAAAVLGMALYTGAIDPETIGKEFVA